MVRVTPIYKGHNFLCIVNKIVIQNHSRQNSAIHIFVNEEIFKCCSAVGCIITVYSEKRKADKTVPWGAPVLVIVTSDNVEGLNLTF